MLDTTKKYCLREDVYFEPLFNSWFAWPYLIPPVTAARYVIKTHKRIMTSFVNNYKLHIMAQRESVLTGAEFLDATEDQVVEVQALIKKIDTDLQDVVQLCDAVDELESLLANHTSGETVEGLYQYIPDILKGYVEIFMDLNHNPSYRLIEPLLYDSPLHKESLQSVSFGILGQGRERPFVFSTPRLPDQDHLHLGVAFNSEALTTLLRSREHPISGAEINKIFASNDTSGGLDYVSLFTTVTPERPLSMVADGDVRLQFIGHAGFLLETSKSTVLIDPVLANKASDYGEEVYSYSDLPAKIDYICITHTHQDHVHVETLLQLRHKTDLVLVPKNNGGSLADPSLKLMLSSLGFKVIELEDFDEVELGDGTITALPFLGEHGDLNIRSKAAWWIKANGFTFFFGADSSNLDPNLYRHIKNRIGHVDVMALGMECVGAPYTWLYGALHAKAPSRKVRESRRLNGSNSEQAMHMVKTFEPNQLYIYALGQEPWYKHLMGIDYSDDSEQIIETGKTIDYCNEKGIPAENLVGRKEIYFAKTDRKQKTA